jgi:hypothetical protein
MLYTLHAGRCMRFVPTLTSGGDYFMYTPQPSACLRAGFDYHHDVTCVLFTIHI